MTTAINEACNGNYCLVKRMFLAWEMGFFFCWWAGFFSHLQGFPQMGGLGEGVEQPIHGGGNKQDKRRGNIYGKMGNTWEYNSGR